MLTTLFGLLSFLAFNFTHLVVHLLVVLMWVMVHTYMRMKAPQPVASNDAAGMGTTLSKQGILVADESGTGKAGEMII